MGSVRVQCLWKSLKRVHTNMSYILFCLKWETVKMSTGISFGLGGSDHGCLLSKPKYLGCASSECAFFEYVGWSAFWNRSPSRVLGSAHLNSIAALLPVLVLADLLPVLGLPDNYQADRCPWPPWGRVASFQGLLCQGLLYLCLDTSASILSLHLIMLSTQTGK